MKMSSDKEIKFIYVAGPITPRGIKSANPAIEYLFNVRDLTRAGLELLKRGFRPFCPALDFLYFLLLREHEHVTEPMIKHFSKDWLRKCDALLLTPNWENSSGTLEEKKLAEKLNLPIFFSIKEIEEYNARIKEKNNDAQRL